MKFEYILFDLDGTLTDPAVGITNSAIYALKKFGIEVSDRKELYKFIGPPLWDSFEKYCGFSKEEANTAVGYFREYFQDIGIFENAVYPGCEDLLRKLKNHDKTLIVATSKPKVFAKQILEHFDIAKYFTFIAGSSLDGTTVRKGDVIRYALRSCNIGGGDLSRTIMIGDREFDIIGAKEVGISSLGVLYGYGSRDELEQAGADFIADSVEDIGAIILGQ